MTYDEDRSQVRTGTGRVPWRPCEYLAVSLLRTHGITNIAQAIRHHA